MAASAQSEGGLILTSKIGPEPGKSEMFHPQNTTVRTPGCGTVTNQTLVQPHRVDFYFYHGINLAVPLRFCALGCGMQ
jgi:hypothetical protein